jgi:hypothetical protein
VVLLTIKLLKKASINTYQLASSHDNIKKSSHFVLLTNCGKCQSCTYIYIKKNNNNKTDYGHAISDCPIIKSKCKEYYCLFSNDYISCMHIYIYIYLYIYIYIYIYICTKSIMIPTETI